MFDLLTTEEAAVLLRMSPQTLANWRCDPQRAPEHGGPRYIRLGKGSIRYRQSELLRWLDRIPAAI
jgi:hypothetical protein